MCNDKHTFSSGTRAATAVSASWTAETTAAFFSLSFSSRTSTHPRAYGGEPCNEETRHTVFTQDTTPLAHTRHHSTYTHATPHHSTGTPLTHTHTPRHTWALNGLRTPLASAAMTRAASATLTTLLSFAMVCV